MIASFRILSSRVTKQASIKRMLTVHSAAQQGFTADSADKYEQGRPTYSAVSLDRIVEVLNRVAENNPDSSRTIVELGAGTGKFTDSIIPHLRSNKRILKEGYDSQNLAYLATEPSEGFRNKIVEKHTQHNEVQVLFATGESIPAESNSVDAIVVAQAFHWMANTTTLKEVHRVLKKNGALIMVWNSYDYCKDWLRYVDREILTPAYGTEVPRQQNGKWRHCFEDNEMKKAFSSLHAWYDPYVHHGNRDTIINRIMSTSVIAEKDQTYQQNVLNKLNALINNHKELENSRKSGHFEVPYVTELVWTFAKT